MKRIWFIIGSVIVILLPVVLLVYQNLDTIKRNFFILKFSTTRSTGEQYAVSSKVPDYTPKIVDSSYLDYVIATMKIFGSQAIVDPAIYRGNRESTTRYTVSRVQIELVPRIVEFLLAIGGVKVFARSRMLFCDGFTRFHEFVSDFFPRLRSHHPKAPCHTVSTLQGKMRLVLWQAN